MIIPHSSENLALADQQCHSYRELTEKSHGTCSALLKDREDLIEERIAFLISPGFAYVATLFGIWKAGGIAVPMSPKHPLTELMHIVNEVSVTRIICDPPHRKLAEQCGIPVLSTEQLLSSSETKLMPTLEDHRRALILFTSGSTGRPKGVVTTHANIRAQVDSLLEAWEWTSTYRILHVLPLHHIHGIVNVLLCSLKAGAVCEFSHPFQPDVVWDRMASGEISLFMAVPTIYSRLIKTFEQASTQEQNRWSQGARSMRLHVSGSAALPVPVLEKWESITGQRLLERYGMTEIGMALSNPYRGERRPGFVGEPLPGVEVRLAKETGEIEVRGPNVFLEYWNRSEETSASFREGWFCTGDIAVYEEGYRILGRSSVDIIKTGGYKVSALEIEAVLREHDLIEDCAVVGVTDSEWGERVALCLVGDPSLTLSMIREWAKERLASYKVPSKMRRVEKLPRNAMGKVQKHLVRQLIES